MWPSARESWDAVSPLLDEALELDPGERQQWLASLRTERPDVAAILESLLGSHQELRQRQFLEQAPRVAVDLVHAAGETVGPYTLIALVGRGGMGTVWAAERADGEVERRVAIKFLRAGGGAAPERFLRERQLLARLNHPAIVQMIDAGHLPDGEPYLVMEFVDGLPIDEYAARLPVPERLGLFLRLCDAVAYAHRHLIIHRDLKPSNILVDRSGHPKVLDFGIAKPLDGEGDGTVTVDRVLTPKYASPEQFTGRVQTTASDIYSLGAVLCSMVTGRVPGDFDAAHDWPSKLRSVDAALPVDLGFVLGKALREEPEERYASVDALSRDVRALLESQPVDARSGDRWYRARKFLRRHRVQAAVAATILLSLSAGLYATDRERRIADRRFQQVRQLANQFIALDADLRNISGSTEVRKRVVEESLHYLEDLGRDARGDTDLSLDIADAYRQVGEVQGAPIVANLGQFADAEETLRKGDTFVSGVLAEQPRNRRAWFVSAQIQRDWMAIVDFQDRRAEAVRHADVCAERIERFLGFGPPSGQEVDAVLQIYLNLATAYSNAGRYLDQVAYARRALAISEGVPAAARRRSAALGQLGDGLRSLGQLDEALEAARTARTMLEAAAAGGGRNERYNLSIAYAREGNVLGLPGEVTLGRWKEAAVAFEHAMTTADDLVARDPDDAAARLRAVLSARDLALALDETDPSKALAGFDEALQRARKAGANPRLRFEQANILADSVHAARQVRGPADAARRLREAFAVLRDLKAYPTDTVEPGGDLYNVLAAAAADEAESGRPEAAITSYRDLLSKMEASRAAPEAVLRDAFAVSELWNRLEILLRANGRSAEADELAARDRQLWTGWKQRLPNNPTVLRRLARTGQ